MNKIKLLKEYTFMEILDIDFNVLIYFDNDNERLLYTLEYIDNNYGTNDFLLEYEPCFDESKVYNIIKAFMMDYLESQLNVYIDENEYKDLKVVAIKDGLKVTNEKTKQSETWNINDYDDDYDDMQYDVKEYLDNNN